MPKKNELEIGDEVLLRGEVVWIDDDQTPRVHVYGTEVPLRVSRSRIEQVIKVKPKKRLRGSPD